MSLAPGPPPPLLDALFWAAVASAFVWLLGPSADWLEGRQPSGESVVEVTGSGSPRLEAGQALRLGREDEGLIDSAHVPSQEVVGVEVTPLSSGSGQEARTGLVP